jgi:hypothetical protein
MHSIKLDYIQAGPLDDQKQDTFRRILDNRSRLILSKPGNELSPEQTRMVSHCLVKLICSSGSG